jgi:hypothetical protein
LFGKTNFGTMQWHATYINKSLRQDHGHGVVGCTQFCVGTVI